MGGLLARSPSLLLPHRVHSTGKYGSIGPTVRERSVHIEGHEAAAAGEAISPLTSVSEDGRHSTIDLLWEPIVTVYCWTIIVQTTSLCCKCGSVCEGKKERLSSHQHQ